MELRWRTVVVTCAGTPLGRELVVRFARAGAGVVVVDRDLGTATAVAALARPSRVAAWAVQADVTDVDDVTLLVARLRDLGGADVVVDLGGEPSHDVVVDLGGEPSRLGPHLDPGTPVHLPAAEADPARAAASLVEQVRATEPDTPDDA